MQFTRIFGILISCCLIQSYASNTYTDIHNFSGGPLDGQDSTGSPMQASNGLIYGMTASGGAHNDGMIFSFDPANVAGTYTNVHDFSGSPSDGADPFGSLMQAKNGVIYGMTEAAGATGQGMMFSYDPSTSVYANIHNFSGNPSDGAGPEGALMQASNGLIYGMTLNGGANSDGIIFSYDPLTTVYAVIHNFGSILNDGVSPYGSLIQASNGLIYGMTSNGGTNGTGMIFSYNPLTSTYTPIYNFGTILNDGIGPHGSLLQASNGLIYGMTEGGGVNGSGMIFSFDPSNVAGSYMDIHDFSGFPTDGSNPLYGSLIQASNGLIYGMTDGGGAIGGGMIFSFDPSNVAGSYTDVHNFSGGPLDGSGPQGSPVQGSNGLVYGITESGGTFGQGIIFSLVVPLPPPSLSLERAFRRSSAPQGYRSRGR